MSESLQAAYGMDGFYTHDATAWSLDAVDHAVEGLDAVRQGMRCGRASVSFHHCLTLHGSGPNHVAGSHAHRAIPPGGRQTGGPNGLYQRPAALPGSVQSKFLIPNFTGRYQR